MSADENCYDTCLQTRACHYLLTLPRFKLSVILQIKLNIDVRDAH